MVQLTVSEAERQGTVVQILRSLLSFFFVYFIITFRFYISFHLFIMIMIIFFPYAFLIMIFPLLVSGVRRVGRLCWVGQELAVLAAAVGRLFAIISHVIANWLAIVWP